MATIIQIPDVTSHRDPLQSTSSAALYAYIRSSMILACAVVFCYVSVKQNDTYTKETETDEEPRLVGFLFRAQPALMTVEASTKIMDSIFASAQNDDARARLLKIIQDFLVSEATKHTAREKCEWADQAIGPVYLTVPFAQ